MKLCAVFVVSRWRNKGLHTLNRMHNEVWCRAEIKPNKVKMCLENLFSRLVGLKEQNVDQFGGWGGGGWWGGGGLLWIP